MANRFFDKAEWRRGFPSRAYARLDDIEPIVFSSNDDLTFLLDAVDADWEGFRPGGPFNLNAPDLDGQIQSHWYRRFEGKGRSDGPDGYEKVPIYRIEVSLHRGHRFFEALPRDEEPWIFLELTNEETDTPVNVYGGLFAPPTPAFLHATPAPTPSATAAALGSIFGMTSWPDASHQDLLQALSPQCEVEALVCFDIGQGSAVALTCRCGLPIYYFDTGCGSGRNAPTAPSTIDFCTCSDPTIILSHWDTDHWAGASGHPGLQSQTWVVPRQTISTSHTAFANDILIAGGRILVASNTVPPIQWSTGTQDYDLQRGTGPKRNGSGFVLIVTDRPTQKSWVLTGDTGFDHIPHSPPSEVAAMVVPHHGADMGTSSTPYPPTSAAYRRLLYSFGPDNGHGPNKPPVRHPVRAAIDAHKNQGWLHGGWLTSPPGSCLAGADVLATATHPASHLNGIAVGWTGAPSLPHLASCTNAMPTPQR